MKSILCASLLILLMPSAYAASLPGDSADGKRLVQSLDGLKKQVANCTHMAKKEFSTY
jgi:hypothetical protein